MLVRDVVEQSLRRRLSYGPCAFSSLLCAGRLEFDDLVALACDLIHVFAKEFYKMLNILKAAFFKPSVTDELVKAFSNFSKDHLELPMPLNIEAATRLAASTPANVNAEAGDWNPWANDFDKFQPDIAKGLKQMKCGILPLACCRNARFH